LAAVGEGEIEGEGWLEAGSVTPVLPRVSDAGVSPRVRDHGDGVTWRSVVLHCVDREICGGGVALVHR
jgi:hypothetical protein